MIGELAVSLIKCLKHFFQKCRRAHLGLGMDSILYDIKQKRFRLLTGMTKKANILKEQNPALESKFQLYERLRKNVWIDLFDVGIILILSYLGDSIERLSSLIGFSLNYVLSKTIKSPYLPPDSIHYCCLFHYIEEKIQQTLDGRENSYPYPEHLESKFGIEDTPAFYICYERIAAMSKEFK